MTMGVNHENCEVMADGARFCSDCGRSLLTGCHRPLTASIVSAVAWLAAVVIFAVVPTPGSQAAEVAHSDFGDYDDAAEAEWDYEPEMAEGNGSKPTAAPNTASATTESYVPAQIPQTVLESKLEAAITNVDNSGRDLRVLGWSADGEYFALEATHGQDSGSTIVVRQVHNALTWNLVRSYRVSRKDVPDAPLDESIETLWMLSKPADQWDSERFVNTTGLQNGKWKLGLEISRPAPGATELTISADQETSRYTWSVALGSLGSGRARTPKFMLTLKGPTQHSFLELHVPFRSRGLKEASSDTRVEGRVTAHYSPDGLRVLLIHHSVLHGLSAEIDRRQLNSQSADRYSTWFVRSTGAQVRVLASGAEAGTIMHVVASLAESGYTVTQVDSEAAPALGNYVYYRGDTGLDIGSHVSRFVPLMKSEALEKSGWYDAIIMLGAAECEIPRAVDATSAGAGLRRKHSAEEEVFQNVAACEWICELGREEGWVDVQTEAGDRGWIEEASVVESNRCSSQDAATARSAQKPLTAESARVIVHEYCISNPQNEHCKEGDSFVKESNSDIDGCWVTLEMTGASSAKFDGGCTCGGLLSTLRYKSERWQVDSLEYYVGGC